MVIELTEQLVVARMEYYGYPPGIVRTAGAKMAQGIEHGEYHRRFGCELTEHGWECTNPETEVSRHPLEDEIERTAEWVSWLLEQLGDMDTDNGQANTCSHASATGIDTAPVGPGKVWRCDHCGLTYVQNADGRRASLVSGRPSIIDAEAAEPARPAHPDTQIGRR